MTTPPLPILIVEDEDDDVEFLRRALKAREVLNPIAVVADADGAKEYLRRAGRAGELPVVAIIDLYLPGGASGLDLLAWMRAQPNLARLPAIVLTVSTDRTHEARAFASNAALVLHKPITPALVVDVLAGLGLTLAESSTEPRSGVVLQERPQ